MSFPNSTIALITGANQGIGLAAATLLARDHNYHVIIGSRTLSNGTKVVEELKSQGLSADTVQLDLTSDDSINAAAEYITKTYGRLDVLVNSAGIFLDIPGHGLSTRELYEKTFQTNLFGPACLTEAVLPLLRASSQRPRVIFVSSTMGSITASLDKTTFFYSQDYKAYDTSKAGVDMLTVNYARVLADKEAYVNVVCPGYVATNMTNYVSHGTTAEVGASRIVELATLKGKDTEVTGTFSSKDGPIPW